MPLWKAWLLAARLKTLPAAVVPVWAGCLLAYQLRGTYHMGFALLTVMGAAFIQIATNFFNDVIDAEKGADTEKRLGPQRATATGLITARQMYLGALIAAALAAVCGLLLYQARGEIIFLIGVPSLYLSYGYTGGPFPLAYRGLGELFVILFFGLIAVSGTLFIQTGNWPWQGFVVGLQIGLLSAVLIAVNNYRDLEEDRSADKRTLVVRWGRPLMRRLIYFMTVSPALLLLPLGAYSLHFWSALVLALFFLFLEWRLMRPDGVSSKLLGLSALHLILFVLIQHLCLWLTSASLWIL